MTAWWTTLYDDLLADVLLERADPAETARTVEFLRERLRLAPGARVLDQCCGTGSLAVPLALLGFDVCAVDQAQAYVERGRQRAAQAGVAVEFHAADAFAFEARPRCDAAFNWWTSFGYAPDDATNARMLLRAAASLEPGGRFALDVPNLPGVLRSFRPSVETRRALPEGEVTLLRESRFEVASAMMHKVWSYTLPGGRKVRHESQVKHYLPSQLADLLAACGFCEVELLGDLSGRPIGLDSPRCIALARRAP